MLSLGLPCHKCSRVVARYIAGWHYEYSDTTSVAVSLGSGAYTVNVLATGAISATTINARAAATVNVGNGGTTSDIVSALVLGGHAPRHRPEGGRLGRHSQSVGRLDRPVIDGHGARGHQLHRQAGGDHPACGQWHAQLHRHHVAPA